MKMAKWYFRNDFANKTTIKKKTAFVISMLDSLRCQI